MHTPEQQTLPFSDGPQEASAPPQPQAAGASPVAGTSPVARASPPATRTSPVARASPPATRTPWASLFTWYNSLDRTNTVAFITSFTITLGLGVMLWRVWSLQANPSLDLQSHMGERLSRVTEVARRGDLTDRRGRPLAATRFGMRVFIDPTLFPRQKTDEAIVQLAAATGVSASEFAPKLIATMIQGDQRQAAIDAQEAARKAKVIAERKKLASAGTSPPAPTQADTQTNAAADPAIGSPVEQADAPSPIAPELAEVVSAAAEDPKLPNPVRYLPITGVLDDRRVDIVRKLKIPGVNLEIKQVREVVAEDLTASLLGTVGTEDHGLMGTEMKLDDKLQPRAGSLAYVRDSRGRPLWTSPNSYVPAQDGQDIKLSLDLELQRIVLEELERGVAEADAAGGRAVMMDPNTGEILALADIVRDLPHLVDYDWKTVIAKDNQSGGTRYRTIRKDPARAQHAALGRNRCVEDIYEPGSTFKPFMWSSVVELGFAQPAEVFNTHNGIYRTPYGRIVTDVLRRPSLTWQEVLINSSNIGMTQGTARMTFQQMHDAVVKFGFGSRPGTGLPGETPGLVTPMSRWSNYTQTSCASGYEVAVTPVQVVRAFSSLARRGPANGTLPKVRMTAWDPALEASALDITNRVLPREVADLTRETLRGVTASLDRKLAARENPETGWQYELFGKSGTAEIPLGQPPKGMRRPKGSDGYFSGQYNSSFIAGGPVDEPRVVMIVVIDDPGPELVRQKNHRGAAVAGPVVRRTMERALAYLGVPPSPPMSEDIKKREQH
jgi:cell division protein FtsI (penicillin-binding protein 3)